MTKLLFPVIILTVQKGGGIKITIAFVKVSTEGGEKENVVKAIKSLTSLEVRVEEAHLCYSGKEKFVVFVKLSTERTEKQLQRWIKEKIRTLDKVLSPVTLPVVRPEDKREEPIEESLIEGEEESDGEGENWGPWR